MTFLTRSNPINDLRTLQARFFEPFFGRFNFADDEMRTGTWAPAVDVAEENDKVLVRVEVPGMDQKDLSVRYEDGLLTISGERQFEQKETRNYHRIERSYGSFARTFSLPRNLDASKINATYKNGVLDIEIPKPEETQPKQIAIKVNG